MPGVIQDCADANVPLATIYTDNFADSGEAGLGRERELVELAKEAGVRLIGPNSMGVIDCHAGAASSKARSRLIFP